MLNFKRKRKINKLYKDITNRLYELFNEGELAYDDLWYLINNLKELIKEMK